MEGKRAVQREEDAGHWINPYSPGSFNPRTAFFSESISLENSGK